MSWISSITQSIIRSVNKGIATSVIAALTCVSTPSAVSADETQSGAAKQHTHQSVDVEDHSHQSVQFKPHRHQSIQVPPEGTIDDTLKGTTEWDKFPNGECRITVKRGDEMKYIPLELRDGHVAIRDGIRALDSLEYAKTILCKDDDGYLAADQSGTVYTLKNHPVVKKKFVTGSDGKRTKANQDNKQAKDQYKYHFIAEELNVIQAALAQHGLRIKVDASKNFAANYANLATVNIDSDRIVALVEKEDGNSATGRTRELYVAEDVMLPDGTLPDGYVFSDFAVRPNSRGRFVDDDDDPIMHLDNESYRINGETVRHLKVEQRDRGESFNSLDEAVRDEIAEHHHVFVPFSFLADLNIRKKPVQQAPAPAPAAPTYEEKWEPAPQPAPQPAPAPAPAQEYGTSAPAPAPAPAPVPGPVVDQCNDRLDNDGDGATDYPFDNGCESPYDNDETGEPLPPAPAPHDQPPAPNAGNDVLSEQAEAPEEETEKARAEDDMYVSLAGNYEYAMGDMVPGNHMVGGSTSVGFYATRDNGKQVGIGVRVKGLYAGRKRTADPRNRVSPPNPNDPEGIGGVAEAHETKRAQVWTFSPEFRIDAGDYTAIKLHAGAGFIKEEQANDRREALVYPNGDVMNETQVHDRSTDYRAVGTAGVGLEVCPVDSESETIDKKVCFDFGVDSTFNGDGASVGGHAGAVVRFEF